MSSVPVGFVRFHLDIPQELELSAYVTVVHDVAKKAVGALMENLKQDFSKVNIRSKGFLEVWWSQYECFSQFSGDQ